MTSPDDVIEEGTKSVSVRMPVGLIHMVEKEMEKRGTNAAAPIYIEAVKFYFDHKDDPAFMAPVELDVLIESKMDELLNDPNRIELLRRRLFRV